MKSSNTPVVRTSLTTIIKDSRSITPKMNTLDEIDLSLTGNQVTDQSQLFLLSKASPTTQLKTRQQTLYTTDESMHMMLPVKKVKPKIITLKNKPENKLMT